MISLFQISTSMPESLFKLIVLSSLVYPYVELENEQNVMNRPLLIKQETEQIERFVSFLLISSILEYCHRGRLLERRV